MTRTTARSIRSEVADAVALIAKKYNLTLELGNGTFNDTDFNVKVKMVEAKVSEIGRAHV